MRQDAWRAYLDMALGVTEASGKKALKTAKKLVGKSGASAAQLQGLADELVRASAANREAVQNLVRAELDRALNAIGLVKAEEVETLTARVRELEAQLQAAAPAAVADDSGPVPSSLAAPVKKTVAKKAVAKKAAPADTSDAAVAEVAAAAAEARAEVAALASKPAPAPTPATVKKVAAKKTVAKAADASGPASAKLPAKKAVAKATPSAVGAEITAPAPGPAGPGPRGAAPAKKVAKKTTAKRTPGSGDPAP